MLASQKYFSMTHTYTWYMISMYIYIYSWSDEGRPLMFWAACVWCCLRYNLLMAFVSCQVGLNSDITCLGRPSLCIHLKESLVPCLHVLFGMALIYFLRDPNFFQRASCFLIDCSQLQYKLCLIIYSVITISSIPIVVPGPRETCSKQVLNDDVF